MADDDNSSKPTGKRDKASPSPSPRRSKRNAGESPEFSPGSEVIKSKDLVAKGRRSARKNSTMNESKIETELEQVDANAPQLRIESKSSSREDEGPEVWIFQITSSCYGNSFR